MLYLTVLISLLGLFCYGIELGDFGAIETVDSWKTAVHNSDAMAQALFAANASKTDRTVVIPSGKTYVLANSTFYDFANVNIQIDGKLIFSNHINDYFDLYGEGNFALWKFYNSEGVHFSGKGVIDGQGMNWWRLCYLGTDNRPNLIDFESTRDITFRDLYLTNSPRFSINFKDCRDILIHDITIYINSTLVRTLTKNTSVMYPLNTDGIDIAAENVTIFNTNITNYDDAIVAKPCRSNWRYCTCSGSIYAYNNTISYSTGLTIGTVPPNADVNCVRNVTFRDTYMYRPLKGLYIKPNPGTSGTGIIEDITFENIRIHAALWWTVYIGPQQQNQPGEGNGTGCNFLFPFVPDCPTQPLVSMKRITLRNVVAEETIPLFESPGVVLCDPANPCTDFVFDRVQNTMFEGNITDILDEWPFPAPGIVFPTPYRPENWTWDYVVTNLYGTQTRNTQPQLCMNDPTCFWVDPSTVRGTH